MANERTFLAWCRTGISLIVFSFVIERFDLLIRELRFISPPPEKFVHLEKTHYMGLIIFILGAFIMSPGGVAVFLHAPPYQPGRNRVFHPARYLPAHLDTGDSGHDLFAVCLPLLKKYYACRRRKGEPIGSEGETMHILILGRRGSGKSFGSQTFTKLRSGFPCSLPTGSTFKPFAGAVWWSRNWMAPRHVTRLSAYDHPRIR